MKEIGKSGDIDYRETSCAFEKKQVFVSVVRSVDDVYPSTKNYLKPNLKKASTQILTVEHWNQSGKT